MQSATNQPATIAQNANSQELLIASGGDNLYNPLRGDRIISVARNAIGFHIERLLLFVLTFTCALAFGQSLPAPSSAPPSGTIRVVMDNNYPPFVFRSNEGVLQGILIDQWRLWERKTGTKVQITAMDWNLAINKIRAGEFDVIDTIFKTPERLDSFDYSQPYQKIDVTIFFDSEISGITDASSLRGFVVGVKAGDAAVELLKRNGVESLMSFPNYQSVVEAAKDHKVTVFVADRPPARYYLYKLGIQDSFRHTAPVSVGEFHRAVAKGNTALLRTVQKGFAQLSPDELKDIEDKWYGVEGFGERSLRYVEPILIAIVVLVLMLLTWNRSLRKAVLKRTRELQASEQRFQSIYNTVNEAVFIHDQETGAILDVNQPMCEMFGYTPEEAVKAHIEQLSFGVPPYGHDEAIAWIRKATAGEPQIFPWHCRRRDGSLFWGEINMRSGQIGAAKVVVVAIRDISERKLAEQEGLRHAHQLQVLARAGMEVNSVLLLPEILRQLVAAGMDLTGAADGTASQFINGQLVFTEYNHGGKLVSIDYRFDSGTGVPGWVMQTREPYLSADAENDPHVVPEIQKALGFHTLVDVPLCGRHGELLGCFELHNKADGQLFNERDVQLLQALAAAAAVAIANARLMEQQQTAETQAKLATEAADRANQAKDQFLAKLSHELRTPLAPVLLATSQWREDTRFPVAILADLAMVHRNLELEVRLIDDLLDLNRLVFSKIELHIERLDLHNTLANALEICRPEFLAKGVTLELECGAREHYVSGDAGRLQQVLWNLIKNAIKFTPAGGTVSVRSGNTGPGAIDVAVSDTGIGMEPETISRIFTAFEQGSPVITKHFGGLGLGLAICKSIADLHGGLIISASAGAGHGATFTFKLPTIPMPAIIAVVVPASQIAPKPPAKSLRILLVEDHADTLVLMKRLLKAMGHRVAGATNVAEALAVARTADGGFDIVLSDLGLPDGSGHDLMRQLRDLWDLHGIAISGFGMEEDMIHSQEAGFDEHLTKPVQLDALRAALDRVAGRISANATGPEAETVQPQSQ